ncbi:hypothetical protein I3843_01G176300 [Carya illinoinensis]|nr:hypothetical protein I3843_01G176300 [Carya illinoinensis]
MTRGMRHKAWNKFLRPRALCSSKAISRRCQINFQFNHFTL